MNAFLQNIVLRGKLIRIDLKKSAKVKVTQSLMGYKEMPLLLTIWILEEAALGHVGYTSHNMLGVL